MFYFEILNDFWRKSQKRGEGNLGKHGPYAVVRAASPRQGRGVKMAHPRVRHDVSMLCHGLDIVH